MEILKYLETAFNNYRFFSEILYLFSLSETFASNRLFVFNHHQTTKQKKVGETFCE